jgi:hypothetical protein
LRETTADQPPDEAAHDRGGSDCKLASVRRHFSGWRFRY